MPRFNKKNAISRQEIDLLTFQNKKLEDEKKQIRDDLDKINYKHYILADDLDKINYKHRILADDFETLLRKYREIERVKNRLEQEAINQRLQEEINRLDEIKRCPSVKGVMEAADRVVKDYKCSGSVDEALMCGICFNTSNSMKELVENVTDTGFGSTALIGSTGCSHWLCIECAEKNNNVNSSNNCPTCRTPSRTFHTMMMILPTPSLAPSLAK